MSIRTANIFMKYDRLSNFWQKWLEGKTLFLSLFHSYANDLLFSRWLCFCTSWPKIQFVFRFPKCWLCDGIWEETSKKKLMMWIHFKARLSNEKKTWDIISLNYDSIRTTERKWVLVHLGLTWSIAQPALELSSLDIDSSVFTRSKGEFLSTIKQEISKFCRKWGERGFSRVRPLIVLFLTGPKAMTNGSTFLIHMKAD